MQFEGTCLTFLGLKSQYKSQWISKIIFPCALLFLCLIKGYASFVCQRCPRCRSEFIKILKAFSKSIGDTDQQLKSLIEKNEGITDSFRILGIY